MQFEGMGVFPFGFVTQPFKLTLFQRAKFPSESL